MNDIGNSIISVTWENTKYLILPLNKYENYSHLIHAIEYFWRVHEYAILILVEFFVIFTDLCPKEFQLHCSINVFDFQYEAFDTMEFA